ncbi:MAG: hypothetical protein Q4A55_03125 [Aerococcus sp.]|nr:hypothetical protein [Aerococcus sp.]
MKKLKGLLVILCIATVISIGLNVKYLVEAADSQEQTAASSQVARDKSQSTNEEQSEKRDSSQSASKSSSNKESREEQGTDTTESKTSEVTQQQSEKEQTESEEKNEQTTVSENEVQIAAEEQYRKLVIPAMKEEHTGKPMDDGWHDMVARMMPYLSDELYNDWNQRMYGDGGTMTLTNKVIDINLYYGSVKEGKMTGVVKTDYYYHYGIDGTEGNNSAIEQVTIDLETNKIIAIDSLPMDNNYYERVNN